MDCEKIQISVTRVDPTTATRHLYRANVGSQSSSDRRLNSGPKDFSKHSDVMYNFKNFSEVHAVVDPILDQTCPNGQVQQVTWTG